MVNRFHWIPDQRFVWELLPSEWLPSGSLLLPSELLSSEYTGHLPFTLWLWRLLHFFGVLLFPFCLLSFFFLLLLLPLLFFHCLSCCFVPSPAPCQLLMLSLPPVSASAQQTPSLAYPFLRVYPQTPFCVLAFVTCCFCRWVTEFAGRDTRLSARSGGISPAAISGFPIPLEEGEVVATPKGEVLLLSRWSQSRQGCTGS